jgi:hypothetical protein
MFLYGEAVKQRSPGSRSAPWVTSTKGFQTLKGFHSVILVEPFQGSSVFLFDESQGALRDPGFCC